MNENEVDQSNSGTKDDRYEDGVQQCTLTVHYRVYSLITMETVSVLRGQQIHFFKTKNYVFLT